MLKPFDVDQKLLHSFITNIENGLSALHEIDHDKFVKFVVASMEESAQMTSDLPEFTWEAIKDKLETHYVLNFMQITCLQVNRNIMKR